MKLRIERAATGLNVYVDEMAGLEATFVDKVRRCHETAWLCPSGECQKIGSMENRVGPGSLFLGLTPKPGEELSAARIKECMGYMLHPYLEQPQ